MVNPPIVAIQMDPIETIKIATDTSFALGLEAQKRGYRLFCYLPEHLSYQERDLVANGYFIEFIDHEPCHYKLLKAERLELAQAKYVLIRQDPPFDMAYITATYLLELLPQTTLVLNNPVGIRNAPEKLLVTHFKDLIPPTLLTRDLNLIRDFINQYDPVIMKPLYDSGGRGILKISKNDVNFESLIELYQRLYREPFILQQYLPEIEDGDKRIILIEGDPVGVLKRIPPKGQARSNTRIGGIGESCNLSKGDYNICKMIKPKLLEKGIHLAGIDVIGKYLIEINVTSPTGIRLINQIYGLDLAVTFWESAEELYLRKNK